MICCLEILIFITSTGHKNVQIYLKVLNMNHDKYAPMMIVSVQNIKRKHRLWERYMEDRSKEKHREYCKARNKVKWLTPRDQKEREKQVAESAKTNSKNFWKFVNSKRKTKTGVSELHDKSESGTFIASSDGDKAEILAIF